MPLPYFSQIDIKSIYYSAFHTHVHCCSIYNWETEPVYLFINTGMDKEILCTQWCCTEIPLRENEVMTCKEKLLQLEIIVVRQISQTKKNRAYLYLICILFFYEKVGMDKKKVKHGACMKML